MQIKKKKVNITPKRGPIVNVDPAIRVPVTNIYRSIEDIRKCIIAEAKVEEVLNNGKRIILNLQNYDQDNGGTIIKVDSNNAQNGAGTPVKKKTQPTKLRELTKAEKESVIKKALNNEALKKELTRTADEADEINAKIKEEELKKTIEEVAKPVEESKPQQYLSRRQLRRLQQQQQEKEAAEAASNSVGELAQELNNTTATDVVDIADPEN